MLSALGALALFGSALATDENAFWIVGHGNALFTSRLDPILNPGAVASHGTSLCPLLPPHPGHALTFAIVHTVIGSSAFDPTYTYDHVTAGKCTTANIAVDRSNYWIPQLYRKVAGGFELVPMNRVNTYYLMRRESDEEEVHEFPAGFRMIAGDSSRNTFNESDYTNSATNYACLGVSGPQTNAFPEQRCPQDLRAQVFFPNCWDGVNNWLEGSKHVAYPSAYGADSGGPCPATHPKRLMSLFYEFHFKDDYEYEAGARVWATGDDVGYSLHGDFTNGWPAGYFKEIFSYGETCNVGFGLQDCPPLNQYFVQNGSSCVPDADGVIVDEDVGLQGSVLATLPGNNPVWGSSAKVPDADYVEHGNFTQAVSVPVTSGWTKMGCLPESTDGRALSAATETADDMSPEKCIAFCKDRGYSIAGIEYSTECYCGADGTSLAALGSDKCSMDCNGISYAKGYCGGPDALTIYQEGGEAPAGNVTNTSSAAGTHASSSNTGNTSTTTATEAESTSDGASDTMSSDTEASAASSGSASASTTATVSSSSTSDQPAETASAAVAAAEPTGSTTSSAAAGATSASGGSSSGHETCKRSAHSRKRRSSRPRPHW